MNGYFRSGFVRFSALLGLLILSAGALFAQELPGIDMRQWSDLAERAQVAIDDTDTEDADMENLRNGLAGYREQFNAARTLNAPRIASLRAQLDQLGPLPAEADGVIEPVEITNQRKELEEQLVTLTAPVQVAESAYARANGLVGEIDSILRTRQTAELMTVTGSPLNPVNWPIAFAAFKKAALQLWVPSDDGDHVKLRGELINNLPVIIFSSVAALVLVMRGRRWSFAIGSRFNRSGVRGLRIWRFGLSLLRIIFPFLGLVLLSFAAHKTGYLGDRGDELIVMIPMLGGLMLFFRWIAEQVFPRDESEALLVLSQKDRAEARFLVSGMTLLLSITMLVQTTLEMDVSGDLPETVLTFPLSVLMGYGLYRIGRLLRGCGGEIVVEDGEEVTKMGTLTGLVRGLGSLTMLIGIAAPVLQAVGYYNASTFILDPTIFTLVVLGLVLALQRFSADVYGTITGQGIDARDSLVPIFIGLVLLLLALPVLALSWGARVADLTEIWTAFRRGFSIGNSRISPTDFITFALIFILGYVATRLAQSALKTNVLPKTKIDKGGQNAIVSGLGYVGIFLAALAAITGAGIDLSSLAIVAGALSVGIGFGLQNIVSNFVSGIILLIERPISEGDWIEVTGGQMGYVRDISVRSTRIETFDKTDVIVPNADLVSGTVINYTRGNTLGRVIIPVGVAYGTDTKKVEAILLEIANAQPMALTNPGVQVLFLNFGASSLDFEIRIFLRDVTWLNSVKNDVNHAIAQRFAEEGIEIPFAQQDVWLRNPEALVAAAAKPARKKATSKAGSKTIATEDGDRK